MAGGGIGEAALIGAALGGVSSAAQGRNPLEGALLGGVTGGAGGALLGGAGGALESAVTPTLETATESALAPTLQTAAATTANAAPSIMANPFGPYGMELGPAGIGEGLGQLGSGTFAGSGTPGDVSGLLYAGDAMKPITTLPPNVTDLTAPVSAPTVTPDSARYFGPNPEQFPLSQSIPTNPYDTSKAGEAPGMMDKAWGWAKEHPLSAGMLGVGALSMLSPQPKVPGTQPYKSSVDLSKFKPSLPQNAVYQPRYAEGGGIANLSGSDDYENDGVYNSPLPMASGGISSLGSYSDGGRMLDGPGDGMSDSIPATIGGKRPARLADGEFVVPADVVSHLGNGSTDAGAKQLYAMMDKVRKARTGTTKQGRQINPSKYLKA